MSILWPFTGNIVGLALAASGGSTRVTAVMSLDPGITTTTIAATDGSITTAAAAFASSSQLTPQLSFPVNQGQRVYFNATGGCQLIVLFE